MDSSNSSSSNLEAGAYQQPGRQLTFRILTMVTVFILVGIAFTIILLAVNGMKRQASYVAIKHELYVPPWNHIAEKEKI